jgi:hypothetical protein
MRPALAPDELIASPLQIGRIFRAGVAAYVLAAFVALWLVRLLIGRTYYLSMAAGNQTYGFRASGFFYIAMVWLLPFCIEYELHAIGTYALMTKRELVESHTLLWPAKHRPWDTLQRIELVDPYRENRAEIERTPECRFTFADGYLFTDLPWLFPFHPDWESLRWPDACRFASQQSGVPVTRVARLER